MLSNAYFLAKFRFDTAENEPAKNLKNLANFPFCGPRPFPATYGAEAPRASGGSRLGIFVSKFRLAMRVPFSTALSCIATTAPPSGGILRLASTLVANNDLAEFELRTSTNPT